MTSDHFYSQKKYIYEYIKNARDFLLWNHEPGLNQLLHRRESCPEMPGTFFYGATNQG